MSESQKAIRTEDTFMCEDCFEEKSNEVIGTYNYALVCEECFDKAMKKEGESSE